jgi:hypothetical protein
MPHYSATAKQWHPSSSSAARCQLLTLSVPTTHPRAGNRGISGQGFNMRGGGCDRELLTLTGHYAATKMSARDQFLDRNSKVFVEGIWVHWLHGVSCVQYHYRRGEIPALMHFVVEELKFLWAFFRCHEKHGKIEFLRISTRGERLAPFARSRKYVRENHLPHWIGQFWPCPRGIQVPSSRYVYEASS